MRQREGMPQPREEQVGPQEAQPCAHTRGGGGAVWPERDPDTGAPVSGGRLGSVFWAL